MERIYLLKGLDCPNCAAKIEKKAARFLTYFILTAVAAIALFPIRTGPTTHVI